METREVRKYFFSVSPSSLDFTSVGGSKSVTVTSYYQTATQTSTDNGPWLPASPTFSGKTGVTPSAGSSSNSAFSVGSVSGSSGTYTVNVTASSNSSTSNRSGSFDISQSRSGNYSDFTSDDSNINVPLSQDGKTVSTYIVQFDDMTYKFGTNTTITSGECTGETFGSTWTLWVSEGDKLSGIIEIENTGNSTKGYLFYIDNYLDNQKTLIPGQVVSETFSFSDIKSHHTMTLQEA